MGRENSLFVPLTWEEFARKQERPYNRGVLFRTDTLFLKALFYGFGGVVVAGFAAAGLAGVADALPGYAWS